MLLGKVLRQALQALDKCRRQRAADAAVYQQQRLVAGVKAALEVVQQGVLAKEVHHRAMRAPAKGFGQF